MGKHVLAVIAAIFATTPLACGAVLAGESRGARAEPVYVTGYSFYRGRGVYQDSGWAYEVPVYRECRVRIIQTASGIDRIRHCL
jgi:hypothetical protein